MKDRHDGQEVIQIDDLRPPYSLHNATLMLTSMAQSRDLLNLCNTFQ